MPEKVTNMGGLSRPVAPPNVMQQIAEARKLLSSEAPDINTTPIQPYGPISKLLMRGAEAYVSPMGTIYANPDVLQDRRPQEIADTLLHELTHVRQMKERSPIQRIVEYFNQRGAYGQRPDEMEAFQAEANRRTKMGRGAIYGTPHFLDDSSETRGDITLFPPRK